MSRRRAARNVVVCLSLVLGGCATPVAAGLEEGDANRVVVALDHAGIDVSKEADPGAEGRFRVLVPRDDAARALSTMADEQLPRTKARGVLEATDRGQLVPSQAAEHAALVAGLAGDLERSLTNVEGVLSARVHLNLPLRDALRDGPPQKPTASVLLEHRGAAPPLAPEAIQRLVAGGAPGLQPAEVAVVFVTHVARPATGRSDIAHVGPIAVTRGSSTMLKGALAGLVLLVVAFAAATLGLWSRLGRARRDHEELIAQQTRAQAPPRSVANPGHAGPSTSMRAPGP